MIVLSKQLQNEIIIRAKSHLGTPYDRKYFNCEHFVRKVYKETLGSSVLPCISKNVTVEDLNEHLDNYCYKGCVLYLVRFNKIGKTRCSHLAILDELSVIHCSYYFGKCVTETSLLEILLKYRLSV